MLRDKRAESKDQDDEFVLVSPHLPSVLLMILCNNVLTGNTLKEYTKDYGNNYQITATEKIVL